MNVISTTVLRNHLADSLDAVADKKNFLLISKKGKIRSVLVNIDFFEDLLAMASEDYLKSIKEAREQYKRGDVFTHEQAFGDI